MRARRTTIYVDRATHSSSPHPSSLPSSPLSPSPTIHYSSNVTETIVRIIWDQSMATRSRTEFRTRTNATGNPEEMPDWAKTLVRSVDEFRRAHDETKTQIEFLMTQIMDLKTERPTEAPVQATTVAGELPLNRIVEARAEEPQWDAAKRGAKPEVTVFEGSLDPKKYMDWEVGLEEYFNWFQLPESRRVQFAQMRLAEQARIYWRNLQITAERRREPPVTSWEEMKSRM